MKIKHTLIILLCFFSSFAFSQKMHIEGNVYDTSGTVPLHNALAMAVRISDSLLLDFTRTNKEGYFELNNVEMDTFSLIISYPGYDDKTYYMFGNPGNLEINIPKITMPVKAQEIEEVIIYANKNPIFYRGDTLVYVADSFNVAENAVVEDLIKKLPGLEVDKDGKIKSQGQEISKVLVDGDEFFGSDPTIATKNLGAKGVEEVKIYETEDEDGEFGSDEKIQVLDLKLKEDAKKGYFGRIAGATDFGLTNRNFNDAFYEGELLLNKFNGSQKISIFALGSNTPRSNFGWGDINKFGLSNESSGGNRWNGGNTTNTSGIPQTIRSGIYYTDKFGEKKNSKLTMNYSYYNTQLEANSASRSQYNLRDTVYFTDDSTNQITQNQSHRFYVEFETKLDSLTTLTINPEFTYDLASDNKTDISQYLDRDNVLNWTNSVNNSSNSTGWDFDGSITLEKKFMKPKRELLLDYTYNQNRNNSEGNLYTLSNFQNTPFINDTIDQSKINNNGGTTHEAYLEYTEPLNKKWKISGGYAYSLNNSDQDRSTYDFDYEQNSYSTFNTLLSNKFETKRSEHRTGLRLNYQTRKHEVNIRGDVRNIVIDNRNLIDGSTIDQNITSFLPTVNYQFKPSMSKRFNIRYSTYSQAPSVSNLQPVPDNSNPNFIKIGNQDLKPNYVHSLNINFNTWQALTGRYIYSGIFSSYTDNAFVDSTSYNAYGIRESKTVNVDGNFNANLFAGAGIPVYQRIIQVRPNINAGAFRLKNYVEDQLTTTDNLSLGGRLEVRFEWDSLEFSIGNNYNYYKPITSTAGARFSNPYSTQSYDANFSWRLPKGFRIQTDMNYNINAQRADGYNINYFIWNAEVSKSFLKTENLILSIVGKDMLNQNVNADRIINGNIITDNRTQIISRYFLMKLTLRFNNNKTKEEDNHGWH